MKAGLLILMAEEWKLNKYSDVPLHQQIYDDIKSRIMNGEWPVGTRIPTRRELASKYQVNRAIVYALGELAQTV